MKKWQRSVEGYCVLPVQWSADGLARPAELALGDSYGTSGHVERLDKGAQGLGVLRRKENVRRDGCKMACGLDVMRRVLGQSGKLCELEQSGVDFFGQAKIPSVRNGKASRISTLA